MFKQFLFILTALFLISSCTSTTSEKQPTETSPTTTAAPVDVAPTSAPTPAPQEEKPTYDFMDFANQDAFEFVNNEKVVECITGLMGTEKSDAILMNMGGAEGQVEFLKNDGNMCLVASSTITHEGVAYDAIIAVGVDGDEVWGATTDENGNLGTQYPDDMANAPKPIKDFITMYK